MNIDETPAMKDLRKRLKALIRKEAPRIKMRNGTRLAANADDWEAWKAWSAKLYRHNFFGRHWPKEYGGVDDAMFYDDFVVADELAAEHIPSMLFFATYAAQALIGFGTEDQKKRFLQRTRDSEIVWCQLFSEPSGGSDLGNLRTRAERRGDVYVVNGQKVWNTQAQMADYGFLMARTSSEGKKHAGITAFMVNMRQPGVTVRPIREITGTDDFNEVFFADAIIPVEDRIGQEGQGWKVAVYALAKERLNTALYAVVTHYTMKELVELAKTIEQEKGGLPDGYRHRLAELHAMCRIVQLLGKRLATREQTGRMGDADPPVAKTFFSDVNLAIATFAMQLLAERGVYEEGDAESVDDGRWTDMFLYARTYTIAGGGSEIMRNVLSERVLGMPRIE